jgi:cytochrome P450
VLVAARHPVHYSKGATVSQRAGGLKGSAQEQMSRLLTERGASFWALVCPLRRFAPRSFVLRHGDCRAVLDRDDVFRVTYLDRMQSVFGPFILGWDPGGSSRYEVEHGWLAAAARRQDGEHLAQRARAVADERIAEGRGRGGLDVVADLADPVIDDAIGSWFGVRTPQPTERLDWARAAFYGVFLNALKVPVVHARAQAGAKALGDQVAAVAAQHEPGEGDVLARLLASQDAERQLDRAAAVRNLVGLVTAWVPQVARLLPTALDVLLDRELELGQARLAARDGDVETVGAYLWEAARFRSTNPLLPRRAAVEHTLPSGTTIPAGSGVVAMLQAAMMDPDVFADPRRFVITRPAEDYMHFGGGLHRCFGEHAAKAQLGQMATALLACDGLRRAPGASGSVRWKGPFPAGLRVAL